MGRRSRGRSRRRSRRRGRSRRLRSRKSGQLISRGGIRL